jgi:hypothetical protein
MKQDNFEKEFTQWGRAQRSIPGRNHELKAHALSELSVARVVAPRSWHAFPWTSVVFAGLALVVIISGSTRVKTPSAPTVASDAGNVSTFSLPPMATQEMSGVATDGVSMAPARDAKMMPQYNTIAPWPGSSGVPAADSREFIRTDYNASVSTRDVEDTVRQLETLVRGSDGRIDSLSSSEKFGSISFVLPATKLDSFRDRVEEVAGSRFIKVNIYQENLLPQKQSIEEQKKYVEESLAAVKAERQKFVAAHTSRVASLQSQLGTIVYELDRIRSITDPIARNQLAARENELVIDQINLQDQLSAENGSYAQELKYLDARIAGAQEGLKGVAKQDQNLLDTVATVRGTISIDWISVWEMIKLYVSPTWMVVILLAAAVISFFVQRRRALPMIG